MKAQFLVDFLVELPQLKDEVTHQTLSVDDTSNRKGSGVGVILEGLNDLIIEQIVKQLIKLN